jgi:hypothetical protein
MSPQEVLEFVKKNDLKQLDLRSPTSRAFSITCPTRSMSWN